MHNMGPHDTIWKTDAKHPAPKEMKDRGD